MKKRNNNSSAWIVGIVVITGAVAVYIYANRKSQANSTPDEPNLGAPLSGMAKETSFSPSTDGTGDSDPKTSVPPNPVTNEAPKPDSNLADKVKETVKNLANPKPRLQDIVSAAKTWMPCDVHQTWIGKPAPDFTVQDIAGKQHKLSDYRGKDVIIVLFAPSFAPSLPELPKLARLQDDMGKDKLVVLGLSFDAEGAVRRYAESQASVTYPIVVAANQEIPAPYSQGKPMPCAMFISPDGVLKLSTRGTLPAEDAKSILEAR
jgi:peroxiredoxin